jgi:hypothetical protein
VRGLAIGGLQGTYQVPAHVHVAGGSGEAKYWLDPIGLASNYGFDTYVLRQIERLLAANHDRLMRAWAHYQFAP